MSITLSGQTIGSIFINLIFALSIIQPMVIYIRAPEHTTQGFIGVVLMGVITMLYVIAKVFLPSNTFRIPSILYMPPIAITTPIYFLTIKQEISRFTAISMIIVLVACLASYGYLLF